MDVNLKIAPVFEPSWALIPKTLQTIRETSEKLAEIQRGKNIEAFRGQLIDIKV